MRDLSVAGCKAHSSMRALSLRERRMQDDIMRDIMKEVSPELGDLPFGGKVVVLGSDFRQVLPVVPRGTRGQIVAASL